MDPLFLGIEIGGTKLQLAVGDVHATLRDRRRAAVDAQRGAPGIREHLERLVPELVATYQPVAIGAGFGGPVDWRTGEICCSHQVPGWSGFHLAEWLQSLSQLPVRIDNDANTAALGEALSGAGVGLDPVFYITLGSGVGGGLVVQRRIYHGTPPGEAEIGHLRLDRLGTIVEQRCSGWAIDRRIRNLAPIHPHSPLAQRATQDPGSESRHLAPALAVGDPVARQLLEDLAGDLGLALSHVTHLFHPAVIVVGGGLSLLGEPLRAAIAQRLPAFLMNAFQPGPTVALAALGEDPVPVGALHLAREAAGYRVDPACPGV